jgi:hypothetical protein
MKLKREDIIWIGVCLATWAFLFWSLRAAHAGAVQISQSAVNQLAPEHLEQAKQLARQYGMYGKISI